MAVTKKFTAGLKFNTNNVFPNAVSISETMTVTVDGDAATSGSIKVTSSNHIAVCTADPSAGDDGDGLDSGARAFVFVKNVGTNDDGDIEIEDNANARIAHLKSGEWAFLPFMHSSSADASVKVSGASATAGYAEYVVIETTTTDY
jgi:hypothetical protein